MIWVVMPCSPAGGYQYFGETCRLRLHIEVVRSFEMLGTTCNTTQCHSPEDQNPYFHHSGNLQSDMFWNIIITDTKL